MRRTLLILGIVAGGALLANPPAAGQITPVQVGQVAQISLGPKVDLQCSMNNTELTVTNPLPGTVPTGTRLTLGFKVKVQVWAGLYWRDEIHDFTGEYKLTSPLAHMAQLHLTASKAVGSMCSASFYGGLPDLQLLQFTRNQSQGTILVRNNNPFVDAGPFVLRIKAMKCSQIELGQMNYNFPGFPRGAGMPIVRPLPLPPGVEYFDVYLDANNTVQESNENNNGYTGVGVCIR
ncbi:MAG TPA: hypothetical protein VMT19_13320 [Thermoanaerobaculaceae bacterium]|nr:hypothetical protein [Thermoanaerobaculaceae bacterium]